MSKIKVWIEVDEKYPDYRIALQRDLLSKNDFMEIEEKDYERFIAAEKELDEASEIVQSIHDAYWENKIQEDKQARKAKRRT